MLVQVRSAFIHPSQSCARFTRGRGLFCAIPFIDFDTSLLHQEKRVDLQNSVSGPAKSDSGPYFGHRRSLKRGTLRSFRGGAMPSYNIAPMLHAASSPRCYVVLIGLSPRLVSRGTSLSRQRTTENQHSSHAVPLECWSLKDKWLHYCIFVSKEELIFKELWQLNFIRPLYTVSTVYTVFAIVCNYRIWHVICFRT